MIVKCLLLIVLFPIVGLVVAIGYSIYYIYSHRKQSPCYSCDVCAKCPHIVASQQCEQYDSDCNNCPYDEHCAACVKCDEPEVCANCPLWEDYKDKSIEEILTKMGLERHK